MNQNHTDAQITAARNWAADCMGMGAGRLPSAERAVAFVKAEYEGGWDAFLADSGEGEAPAETQPQDESRAQRTVATCGTCGTQEITHAHAAGRGWQVAMNALRCPPCARHFPDWMRKSF
jgi:hypothetical protein